MTPGPSLLYKCPNCGNAVKKGTLLSGNTFGATLFSDVKRIAPMLPEFTNITKCKKCDTIFWLNDKNKTGEENWSDMNKVKFDKAYFLSIDDYIKAIDSKIYENIDDEKYLRIRLWWSFNDRIRNNDEIFSHTDDKNIYEINCKALLGILNIDRIDENIMMAEVLRNLGEFEKCNDVIEKLKNEKYFWVKEMFKEECDKKNKWVVVLKNNAYSC
jgi:hypothetical protein